MRQTTKRNASKKTVAAPVRRRINISSSLSQSKSGTSEAKIDHPNGFLDKIIFSCLALIFTVCPLFFLGLAAQGTGFEKMILFYFLVLVGSIAYIAKGVAGGGIQLRRTILDWPILGLVIIAIISTISSIGLRDSLLGAYGSFSKSLTALLIFILFYYLLVNNVNAKRVKILFRSLIISSSIIVVYSLAQLFGIFILPFEFTQTTNFNPIGSASNLSIFLVIFTPLLIVAINQLKGAGNIVVKVLLSVILLLNLLLLTVLKSFTFWPMVIIGIIIIVGFAFLGKVNIEKINLLALLGIFIISTVFLVDNIYFKDVSVKETKFIPDNIFALNIPVEVGLSRSASWDIAKSSLKERPMFGSGLSTFYYSFNKYKDIGLNKTNLWNISFDNPTGLLFGSLVTLGIIGTLVVIVLFVISAVLSFLSLVAIRDEENRPVLLGLFTSFVSITILSFLFSFNSPLALYSVLISFLCLAGSVVLVDKKVQVLQLTFKSQARYKLISAFLLIFIVIITLIVLGGKMYIADVYAKQSIDAKTVEEKVAKLEKAINLGCSQDGYYIGLSNYYKLLFNQAAIQGDKEGAKSSLTKAVELSEKATNIAPNKSGNNQSLALLYESLFLYDKSALIKAENQYKKVIELEPTNPTPYLRLGLIRMAQANGETVAEEKKYFIEEAIKQYDEALKRKDNLVDAYQGKSIAYENLGNTNQAIASLAQASNIDPNNVSYRFELARLYFNKGIEASKTPQDTSSYTEQELRVSQIRKSRGLIEPNKDLKSAEQLFLSVLLKDQKHANSRYSLALLYQKIGDFENASIMVKSLINILEDETQKESIRKQFPGLY